MQQSPETIKDFVDDLSGLIFAKKTSMMDIASFFTDLLIKPDSDLSRFLNKLIHIILLYMLSFVIWDLTGGTVKIPKEISVILVWNFVFSGQILIPIILIFITSRIVYFTKNIFFPLLILSVYLWISKIAKIIYRLSYKKINRPTKKILSLLIFTCFLSVSSRKIKKGKLFNIYKIYAKKINIAEVSKEHIIALDLIYKILVIWICLVGPEGFAPYYFYRFIKWSLFFLAVYVPVNLSALYFINDYKKPISLIIDAMEYNEKTTGLRI